MKIIILGSGSKGNSTLIQANGKTILIDVGFSYKQICEKLRSVNVYPKDIDYLFITHDHSDHINGLKVLLNNINPIVYIDKRIIDRYSYIQGLANIRELNDENALDGNIVVKSIPTSHDATSSCGYMVDDGNESMVLITDTGYINEKHFIYLKNREYYLIESNHDVERLRNGSYPLMLQERILSDVGHMCNEMSAMYMTKLIGPNTKKIMLCHLSEENNTEDLALSAYAKAFKEKEIDFNNIECAKQYSVVEVN